MELIDSNIEVIWDPDTAALRLVGLGDPMWEEVEMDGGQLVQVARRVRASGIKAIPRNNEEHVLTFGLAVLKDTIPAAEEARFELPLGLPRGSADVLLVFESGTQYRLLNAAVRGWPNGKEGRLVRASVEIVGGEYVRDSGSYTVLQTWADGTN